jgi:hypothetical protein
MMLDDWQNRRTVHTRAGAFSGPLWGTAQLAVLAATLILIAGFVLRPDESLDLLWGVLIPVLPLTFLLGTGMWRSICPLATLNMLPNPWAGRRAMSSEDARTAGLIGIVLLFVLVPARRFFFNTNGLVMAATVLGVALLALALGFVYDAKAGFCNAVCPVLPVERLYGQYPLLSTDNPRCPSCTACTPRTCVDLSPTRSLLETIGPSPSGQGWLQRPYGIFAASFPGFVAGYYTTGDVPLAQAGTVYLQVFSFAFISYVLVWGLTTLTGAQGRIILPLLASAAVAIYYWFAAPLIATALGLPDSAGAAIRVATLLAVGVWLSSALRAPLDARMETVL